MATPFLKQKFLEKNLMATKDHTKKITSEEKEENVIEWITFYRRNWNIYAERVLGIKLRPFQHFMLWLMANSNSAFFICSRGISKTWICGLGAIIYNMLYPYSKVVITSSTIGQSNIMIEKKIRDEIILKLSPYLRYLFSQGYIEIKKDDDSSILINRLNNATITVLPCLDSARGKDSFKVANCLSM